MIKDLRNSSTLNAKKHPVGFSFGHIGPATDFRSYEDRGTFKNITTAGGLQISLAIVADGIGGENLGQRAAQLTVDTILEECVRSQDENIPQMLGKAIGVANRRVYTEARDATNKRGMSSTASIAAISDNRLYVANVGDSRVYLIREKKIFQLTQDHTWAHEKIQEGMSKKKALQHPRAGYLARSIGMGPKVRVDLGLYLSGGETGTQALKNQGLKLDKSDQVLVCSDGLIKDRRDGKGYYVEDNEIRDVIKSSTPEQAAKTLVDLAIGRDVDDNVTAVVVEMPGRKKRIPRPPAWALITSIVAIFAILAAVWPREKPEPQVERVVEEVVVYADTPTPAPTSTPAPAMESSSLPISYPSTGYGPNNFPPDINPLTGLSVDDQTLLDRRPIAIKTTLFPRSARPQWGLSKADLVFEYYHEGGITRFFAIFYGQDVDQVAPIRSARFSDENFIQMYKSTMTYGGTYEDVLNYFNASSFADRLLYAVPSNPCPAPATYPVCRYKPKGVNHLMASTSAISNYFEEQGVNNSRQDLNGMPFAATAPVSDLAAKDLRIRYSDANFHRWAYDADISEYVRYQDRRTTEEDDYAVLVDRLTNVPISVDNVVVLVVEHASRESSHESIDLQLDGLGDAYAFRDGQMYKLNWNRLTKDSVLYLTYPNGRRYSFRPGATWFELVGINSDIQEQDDGLRIRSYTP